MHNDQRRFTNNEAKRHDCGVNVNTSMNIIYRVTLRDTMYTMYFSNLVKFSNGHNGLNPSELKISRLLILN